jgi:hypothetical protein
MHVPNEILHIILKKRKRMMLKNKLEKTLKFPTIRVFPRERCTLNQPLTDNFFMSTLTVSGSVLQWYFYERTHNVMSKFSYIYFSFVNTQKGRKRYLNGFLTRISIFGNKESTVLEKRKRNKKFILCEKGYYI